MNASPHVPKEVLYDSEAALRLVDRAIGDLTGEIELAPDDPRFANLAHAARRLAARCAALERTIDSMGADRSRVGLKLLADAADGIGDIEERTERLNAMLLRSALAAAGPAAAPR
jgi:hypothetical protein